MVERVRSRQKYKKGKGVVVMWGLLTAMLMAVFVVARGNGCLLVVYEPEMPSSLKGDV